MMGTMHPHLQASEASAPGGGYQRFPRNEGGRCERQRAYSPPCVQEGNLFSKVSPEAEPLLLKPKVGLEGGIRITHFHPPDCGGATSVHHYDGNNAPPLASERSERARRRGSEIPEKWGRRGGA
jgi:hypothetical protein